EFRRVLFLSGRRGAQPRDRRRRRRRRAAGGALPRPPPPGGRPVPRRQGRRPRRLAGGHEPVPAAPGGRPVKRLLAVVALLLAIGTAPAAAQSRESEIIAVRTQATVNPDGSMDVVELLAYDFTDDRNGGFRTFVPDPANYRIVDFRV